MIIKNQSVLLNVLLSMVVVILVYQLSIRSSRHTSASNVDVSTHVISSRADTLVSAGNKVSVGAKGWIMPKPALVIGSYDNEGNPNIMTASWVGIVNSNPMSIGVSVRSSRHTYKNIMETRSFTVNVPSARFVAHMDYAGVVSGRDEDKFKTLGLTPIKGTYVNAPVIDEFPIVIECEVTHTFDLGSHTQFVGKVIDTRIDAHLLTENGRVDIEQLNPIIHEDLHYYGYGQRLGKPFDVHKVFVDGKEPAYYPEIYANPTLAVIHNRKSVRSYTNRPVSRELLSELVKAGMAAPSAVDKRPWAFVAITDRAMLDKLADVLPYAQMLREATAAIVVCGDMNKALSGDLQAYWVQDCSAATQNILLAAESMGLGAVWTGVHPVVDREKVVVDILGAPEHIVPLNVIAVGYPAGLQKPKNKWDASILHWERW
jgi:flavin reductase (DIM6/NTAB) family NADH-FMN oxidoreductase RutF/nitroreductase